jgi:hypothetical protein
MQERPLFDRHTINGDCNDWIIPEQLKNFVAFLFIFGKGGLNEAAGLIVCVKYEKPRR